MNAFGYNSFRTECYTCSEIRPDGERQSSLSRNMGGLEISTILVFESDRDPALVALRRMQIHVVEPNDES